MESTVPVVLTLCKDVSLASFDRLGLVWSLVATNLRVLSESGVEGSLAVGWLVHHTQSTRVLREVRVSASTVVVVDNWLGVNLGK